MGHSVTGLIAKPTLLEAFASRFSLHSPAPLNQGLAFLPLRDEDIDSFVSPPQSGYAEGFTYLSEQLAGVLSDASHAGSIVYAETDYFSGLGVQGAAVYLNGVLVFGPKSAAAGPINDALRLIGDTVTIPDVDEFEAVGLARYRSTDDWLDAEE
jgi:hypothetical protein